MYLATRFGSGSPGAQTVVDRFHVVAAVVVRNAPAAEIATEDEVGIHRVKRIVCRHMPPLPAPRRPVPWLRKSGELAPIRPPSVERKSPLPRPHTRCRVGDATVRGARRAQFPRVRRASYHMRAGDAIVDKRVAGPSVRLSYQCLDCGPQSTARRGRTCVAGSATPFVYDGVRTHQWYDGTPHPWNLRASGTSNRRSRPRDRV